MIKCFDFGEIVEVYKALMFENPTDFHLKEIDCVLDGEAALVVAGRMHYADRIIINVSEILFKHLFFQNNTALKNQLKHPCKVTLESKCGGIIEIVTRTKEDIERPKDSKFRIFYYTDIKNPIADFQNQFSEILNNSE